MLPQRENAHPSGETIQALQESREWLRVTLSSIGDGVITTDASGNCTFVNPVAEALTGWSNLDATTGGDGGAGLPLELIFRIVNEDTRATVENPALRALREGLVVGLANHTLLIAKDGTERPIDDSGAPIRNASGAIAGVVLVFRDITDRRVQERTIQEALDFAQNMIATIRNPLIVLDGEFCVVPGGATRAFYKTFKVTAEETEGRSFFKLGNHQWNIPHLRALLEGITSDNNAFDDFEVEHDFERVGRKIMLVNARQLVKPGNNSKLLLVDIEDITERHRLYRQIRESEQRYRRLFESAKDGILILDAHSGRITDANPYIGELIGLGSPEELRGKQLWEIGLFKDIIENKEMFTRLQRDGYVQYDHLPLRNLRGERVDVEFVSNLYREQFNGHPNGEHGDNEPHLRPTEHGAIDQGALDDNRGDHRGERLVAQCNIRSIAERRLRDQTRAMSEESRRKDEFLAMLSHELRNPLAPIRSAVHLLKAHSPETTGRGEENLIQKQAREIIERQTANLAKIIGDLLEVSRVLSGRVRLDLQVLDLNQLIQHAVETVHPLLQQRKHKITIVSCEQGSIWVSADATRIEEVLVNILNNACKYTPEGGGHIQVWCESVESEESSHAQVRIRDNGDGIDRELLAGGRIFDLFTQADRTLARSSGGLGIGLSLSQKIVQLHGGTICAYSPPEGEREGTEVVVRLPLHDPLSLQPRKDPAPPENTSTHTKVVRVLMVDDNVDQVVMIVGALRASGYAVQSAYTGPEGLKVAQQWRPEVILLDIGLPGMDGYELARCIRSSPKLDLQKATLIALTGYGRDCDVDRVLEAGFDHHMVKPYEVNELLALISECAAKQ